MYKTTNMLYSLGSTGKVVDISLIQFLTMGDLEFMEEIRDLQSHDLGNDPESPFYLSVLNKGAGVIEKSLKEDEEPPLLDLTDLDKINTLLDLDSEEYD